jgi:hypothetical protein
MSIHVGGAEKSAALPEPAFGLSRYVFDEFLWTSALERGAVAISAGEPNVITTGPIVAGLARRPALRLQSALPRPVDDAVELYFRGDTYVGINCVEDGLTNVCGLAPGRRFESRGVRHRRTCLS